MCVNIKQLRLQGKGYCEVKMYLSKLFYIHFNIWVTILRNILTYSSHG